MINLKTTENSIKLLTAGKYCNDDINVTFEGNLLPTGTIEITENGQYDVSNYANANVNVESGGGSGNVLKRILDGTKSAEKLFYMYPSNDVNELIQYNDTENVKKFTSIFCNASNITILPLLNTSKGTTFTSMYSGCTKATSFPQIDTHLGTTFEAMYQGCSNATSFPQIDTSLGTTFTSMYSGCTKATSFPQIDTSLGTTFTSMYSGCTKATSFPQIDTSNGTNFSEMLSNCTSAISFPLYNLSKATRVTSMFSNAKATHFPAFDVRNVTNFGTTYQSMYSGCSNAISILMYGMKTKFTVVHSSLLEAEALVTILSNCQVITSTQTLTLGSTLLAKLEGVYVKETGVEQYEGITCRPCVICESTDAGAMLATDYFTGKGWTLA